MLDYKQKLTLIGNPFFTNEPLEFKLNPKKNGKFTLPKIGTITNNTTEGGEKNSSKYTKSLGKVRIGKLNILDNNEYISELNKEKKKFEKINIEKKRKEKNNNNNNNIETDDPIIKNINEKIEEILNNIDEDGGEEVNNQIRDLKQSASFSDSFFSQISPSPEIQKVKKIKKNQKKNIPIEKIKNLSLLEKRNYCMTEKNLIIEKKKFSTTKKNFVTEKKINFNGEKKTPRIEQKLLRERKMREKMLNFEEESVCEEDEGIIEKIRGIKKIKEHNIINKEKENNNNKMAYLRLLKKK